MQRRALLQTLAAGAVGGVTGCLDASSGDSDDGSNDESDGSDGDDPGGDTQPTPGPEPPDGTASVIDLETAPVTYAYRPTRFRTDDDLAIALWFDRTATDEHPARLTGWLRNENQYEHTADLEWIPGVGDTHSRTPREHDHTARLHFAPTAGNELASTVPSLSRTDDGRWIVDDVGPWIQEHVRLDPGEQVGLEYAVVGEPETPGPPAGVYEWRGDDETVRLTAWQTASPGPAGDSRFAGRSVPSLGEEQRTRWYHEADETTPTYLEPEREQVDLDGAVAFRLVNNSAETLRCGHWDLYKLVDGRWFPVGPMVHTSDCRGMAPGERMDWTLRAFNGEAVACNCDAGCAGGLTRGHLGGGTYGVVAGYAKDAHNSGALLELSGDPVTITPTEDVAVARSDGQMEVTTPAYGDGEHPPDASLTLQPVSSGGERVLPEQVMGPGNVPGRGTALRNALGVVDDEVDRVVVRTDEHDAEAAIGHDRDTRRIHIRGQSYELAIERASE